MGGGPRVVSLIPSYPTHVAACLWDGTLDRGKLHCQCRFVVSKKITSWFRCMNHEAKEKVLDTPLSHLPMIMAPHIDAPLIYAFVERWQPDTNTFHLPFGEMTIMLHDIVAIVGIPIEGRALSTRPTDQGRSLITRVCELLSVREDMLKPVHWNKGGLKTTSIIDLCSAPNRDATCQVTGWLMSTIGCCLFTDKSKSRLSAKVLLDLDTLDDVGEYSWGSACLAYLYRQLGVASRSESRGIGGCLALLQAWIYEHFPCFRHRSIRKDVAPGDPRASRWIYAAESKDKSRLASFRARLDRLTPRRLRGRHITTTRPLSIRGHLILVQYVTVISMRCIALIE
ncbi:protein MAINTENANCE OF MERISTEMS-like [Spinacia oleracea]|uniref:Protein MAINTENANCE OF MERISTEMS-like n=1 Tax=Spinacia oleracea TaxID=3562 RepID=A0A9R0IDW1_SPIOL|nr:protein MAINTENANCE OF MERISTEMS-like [Spinacia oleracea]